MKFLVPLLFLLPFLITPNLIVYSPQPLIAEFPENIIRYSLANFGYIPYGRSLIAPVKLANPILGCSPIDAINHDEIKEAPFLIIKRGNCTFVTKVKYAQLAGAKMAIIVDDKSEQTENITMIDDGFSYSLRIPSIFIEKDDGEKIINSLQSSDETRKNVILKITFDSQKSDKIDFVFWISTSNRNSFRLVNEFEPYYHKLKNKVTFTPHYAIWTCHSCYRSNYTEYPDNCISGGRYCCPDPDGNGPATGAQVVQEDLRQMCIFQHFPDKWWDYMRKLDSYCVEYQVVEECSRSVMKSVDIDQNVISDCFNSGFIKSGKEINVNLDDNTMLKEERNTFIQYGIQFWPSVTINKEAYKGNLEGEPIFEAVCSYFNENEIPEACYNVLEIKINEQRESINAGVVVIVVISVLLVFFVFLVCIYKRWVKKSLSKDMNAQVNQMVSQYIAFYENREKKNTSSTQEAV